MLKQGKNNKISKDTEKQIDSLSTLSFTIISAATLAP